MRSINRMRIKTELLPDGISLKHPIHNEQDQLLLEAGMPITASIKQKLLDKGTEWVVLHQSDAMEVMGHVDEPAEAPVPPQPQKEHPTRPLPPLGRINAKVDALDNTVSLSVENSGPPPTGENHFQRKRSLRSKTQPGTVGAVCFGEGSARRADSRSVGGDGSRFPIARLRGGKVCRRTD